MSEPSIQSNRNAALDRTFGIFDEYVNVDGKAVYEVGCDREFVSAKHFVESGAVRVECTNFSQIDDSPIHGADAIHFHRIDASNSKFDSGSFDVVFGRAILEHVPDIAALAKETFRLLKPGGRFYLDGGPMWTCKHGHHVWVTGESGILYNFSTNNPFEAWEHLSYSNIELERRLLIRGIPERDAETLARYLLETRDINRTNPEVVSQAFEQIDGLDCASLRFQSGPTPPLIEGYSPRDLATGMLVIIGQKSGSKQAADAFANFVSQDAAKRFGDQLVPF